MVKRRNLLLLFKAHAFKTPDSSLISVYTMNESNLIMYMMVLAQMCYSGKMHKLPLMVVPPIEVS